MRRALVTGGAGFIGSHLADALIASGHEVYVLDDLSTGSLVNVEHLRGHTGFHVVVDSVLHHAVVNELVHKCDVVYHLAAAVGVRLVVEEPVRTITTNIRGTETVLDLCARFDKPVLLASTSEIYGDRREPGALHEDDRRNYGPTTVNRWAYAATKEIDEFLALAWHRTHGLPAVVARLFNTVGPRQTGAYGMVMPRFAAQALAGAPIEVHGDGSQTRCFLDVDDCVRAMTALMDAPDAAGRVFNVGSDRSLSILELARLVRERAGSSSPIELVPYEQAYGPGFEDMRHRQPDIRRISEAIGWRPSIPLEETIDRVLAAERARRPHAEAAPA
jgi:UDP-glucose 4-epimerase